MKISFFLFVLCLNLIFQSCGQAKYMTSLGPTLGPLAIEGREPAYTAFVTYNNRTDTIKGEKLKWHVNSLLYFKRGWTMDGYSIPSQNITTVQSKYAFLIKSEHGFYVRLYRGSMKLFCWKYSNPSKTPVFYDSTINQTIELKVTKQPKFLFLGNTIPERIVSVSALKELLIKCPEAIASIEREFAGTTWLNNSTQIIFNEDQSQITEKLIRILKVYDKCK